jgi:hypothetical protein
MLIRQLDPAMRCGVETEETCSSRYTDARTYVSVTANLTGSTASRAITQYNVTPCSVSRMTGLGYA